MFNEIMKKLLFNLLRDFSQEFYFYYVTKTSQTDVNIVEIMCILSMHMFTSIPYIRKVILCAQFWFVSSGLPDKKS